MINTQVLGPVGFNPLNLGNLKSWFSSAAMRWLLALVSVAHPVKIYDASNYSTVSSPQVVQFRR